MLLLYAAAQLLTAAVHVAAWPVLKPRLQLFGVVYGSKDSHSYKQVKTHTTHLHPGHLQLHTLN